MKTKVILLSLFLAATSCSKEKNLFPDDYDWNSLLWSIPPTSSTQISTPKGMASFELVGKEDLPTWTLSLIEGISNGYIMKAGSGNDLLYFIYDVDKDFGQHYDAQGNPAPDNKKLKDWVIIYWWKAEGK